MLIINFVLTPLWLHMMYGQAFVIFSSVKIVKNLIKLPIDAALLYGALKAAERTRAHSAA